MDHEFATKADGVTLMPTNYDCGDDECTGRIEV